MSVTEVVLHVTDGGHLQVPTTAHPVLASLMEQCFRPYEQRVASFREILRQFPTALDHSSVSSHDSESPLYVAGSSSMESSFYEDAPITEDMESAKYTAPNTYSGSSVYVDAASTFSDKTASRPKDEQRERFVLL